MLRNPLAIGHAPVHRIDATIAKLRMVVADIDDDAARYVRKQCPRKIGANAVRLSGPLELAIET